MISETPVQLNNSALRRLSIANAQLRERDSLNRLQRRISPRKIPFSGVCYGARAKRLHHSLKSPACSCLWITLPASSQTRITSIHIGNQIDAAMIFTQADFEKVHAHKPLQCPSKGIGLKSNKRNCRQHCQTSSNLKRKGVMKFVSLRTKQAHRPSKLAKPSRVHREFLTTATAPPHQIHTYAELRQQIHNDLRLQHPEWIQPNGESPICDSYEARLIALLARD